MKNTKIVFLLSGLVLGLNAFGSEQNINASMVGKGPNFFLQNVEKAIKSQDLTWLTITYSMAEVLTNREVNFVGFKSGKGNFIGYQKNLDLERKSYYCFESPIQEGMVMGFKIALAYIIRNKNEKYFLNIKGAESISEILKPDHVECFSKFEE